MNPDRPDATRRPQAVALHYGENDPAPRVVAKGYGDTADAIIAKAREHGLHTHASPALTRLLMDVDLDEHIPPELYQAVAELLAWVLELEHAITDPPQAD